MRSLTKKQEKFVTGYLEHMDGARAYREAYEAADMSQGSVRSAVCRLFKNPIIAQRVSEFRTIAAGKLLVTKNTVLQELARIAFLDPRHIEDKDGVPLPLNELSDNLAGAIAGMEVTTDNNGSKVTKYKFWPKTVALKELADKLKLFEEKNDGDQAINIKITVNKPVSEEIPEEFLVDNDI